MLGGLLDGDISKTSQGFKKPVINLEYFKDGQNLAHSKFYVNVQGAE